jgi:hypothetical protein
VHIAAKCIKTWVTKRNITERNTLKSLFSKKKRSQIYPHRNQGKKDMCIMGAAPSCIEGLSLGISKA